MNPATQGPHLPDTVALLRGLVAAALFQLAATAYAFAVYAI